MDKHRKIILWSLWLDLLVSSFSLIWAVSVSFSPANLLSLLPIIADIYLLRNLSKGSLDRIGNLAILSITFSIYLIDSGIYSNTGTYLYYFPLLIGIFLFDALGCRKIISYGLSYFAVSFLLVNIGWSPRLIFEQLSLHGNPHVVMLYNIGSALFSCCFILYLFSKLRKESNEELLINQANLVALLENSKDAIWSVDTSFNLISYNSVYAGMYRGFWHKDPESGVSILFPAGKHKIYENWNNWYRRAIRGESFTFDQEYQFRDGSKIFEVSFTSIIKNNKVHGTVVKAIDVTQRKRALQQQELISENLELLLGSTQEIIFEMDDHDRCKKIWKGENRVLHLEDSYYLGKSVEELFDKPFQISLKELFEEVKKDGIPRELEYSYTYNQSIRHSVAKLRKIKNSEPARVSIVLEDIGRRKEAEMKQVQQSLFLNKLIAHLPIGVFVKSVKDDLSYTLWNKELEYLFGIEEADVLGKTDQEVFKNSGEIAHYLATDQMVLNDKEPVMIQKLSIEAGDKQIFARTFKIPILDADGNVESILGILENISDVVKTQQELEIAEKRWNYALSGSRDAVWDVDLISDESFFSPAYYEMLGYDQEDKISDKWENLVHPDDLVRAWNLFVDHLEGKSPFYECEYRLLKKDGSYIWVLDRGKIAESDDDGNPTRIIGTFSDITYRKKLEEEYKIALEKAEAASHAKSLFLSTMSHEIRTPMNGVIGIINLLRNENQHPEQKENLQALKYSADNLMFLLNDILDFSKIDAGKIDIEESSFNLYSTLQNTLKSFIGAANEKGLKLELKASNNFPMALLGDALRLNQIFNNLISNALKFTPKGRITVEALTRELTETDIRILFKFTDTGIGIEDEFLPHIFEHFTQASNDTTRKYGGTGLGLAICKRLVEILGGQIKVESKKGTGTCFSFELQFRVDPNKNNQTKEEQMPAYESYPGMRVLLVEDNQMNVFVAKKFLSRWEMEVVVSENGQDALDEVLKNHFDLILMDLQMPVMDGFESAEIMRSRGIHTPIFALSANVNLDAKTKVFEIGMNEYISKPFDPKELFEKIGKYYKPKEKDLQPKIETGKLF